VSAVLLLNIVCTYTWPQKMNHFGRIFRETSFAPRTVMTVT